MEKKEQLKVMANYCKEKFNSFCLTKLKQFKEQENSYREIDKSSSEQEHRVNALAPRADEGRGKLRKAWGSCKRALIPGCPNGAIHWE